MIIDVSEKLTEAIALKQSSGDKLCMAVSAAMAFDTSVDDFLNFLKDISAQYKNIRTKPGFGLIELKLYALKYNSDIEVITGNPPDTKGPAIVVVNSENYANTLHAIFMDANQKLHDPNPNTPDGRDLSTYSVVEWYKIIPFSDP